MTEIEGIVENVVQKEKNYGLYVDGVRYGGWGQCPVVKGDVAKIDFELSADGQWKNIKKIEKTGESTLKETTQKTVKEIFPTADKYNKDSIIIRQVAFKGAIEILSRLIGQKEKAYSFEGLVEAVKNYTDEFDKIILKMD